MYRFQVNGTQYEVQEDQRLIDFLRADLKLTGTKKVVVLVHVVRVQ